MRLSEFNLAERGPRKFDQWEWKESVESPLGDFKVVFQVEMNQRPTSEMLTAAEQLVARFNQDKAALAQKVFQNYSSACTRPYGSEWLRECGVPEGLSLSSLSAYIDPRELTVDSDLNMSVYTSPNWDREHGLYFDLVDGSWTQGA